MDVDQLKRLFRSVERHIGTLKDATGALENLLSSTDKTAVRNSVGNVRQIGTTLQEECRDIQQFLQLCDGQPETHLNSPSSLTYAKQLRDIEVENHPLDPGGADGIDGVFHIASPVDLEMRVDHMYEEFQSMRHYIKRLVPTLSRTSVERRIQELSHEPQDAIIERCRKNEDMVGAELDKAKADLEARETELDKLRCELERCARPEEKRELQKKLQRKKVQVRHLKDQKHVLHQRLETIQKTVQVLQKECPLVGDTMATSQPIQQLIEKDVQLTVESELIQQRLETLEQVEHRDAGTMTSRERVSERQRDARNLQLTLRLLQTYFPITRDSSDARYNSLIQELEQLKQIFLSLDAMPHNGSFPKDIYQSITDIIPLLRDNIGGGEHLLSEVIRVWDLMLRHNNETVAVLYQNTGNTHVPYWLFRSKRMQEEIEHLQHVIIAQHIQEEINRCIEANESMN